MFGVFNFLFNIARKKKYSRRKKAFTLGEYYDLQNIFDMLNVKYFEGQIKGVSLSWFGNPDLKPRSKIVFGSYHLHKKTIKIHRLLDKKETPLHVVSYILYHEMLHHVHPPLQRNKRRQIHHKEFKKRERLFEEYDLAKAGIEELLTRMWPRRKKKVSN